MPFFFIHYCRTFIGWYWYLNEHMHWLGCMKHLSTHFGVLLGCPARIWTVVPFNLCVFAGKRRGLVKHEVSCHIHGHFLSGSPAPSNSACSDPWAWTPSCHLPCLVQYDIAFLQIANCFQWYPLNVNWVIYFLLVIFSLGNFRILN